MAAMLIAQTLLAGTYSPTLLAATPPEKAQTDLVYVGTQARQIHAFRFDPSTGKPTLIGPVVEGLKSTWIAAHPTLPVLYSVDDDNNQEGTVTAFSVDRTSGALAKLGEVGTGGNGTTNLYLDRPSMTLLAANYGSGSISSIGVEDNGNVASLVSTVKETGSGPNRRQASAHAHSAVVDPSGHYALVPDLGADRVFIYGFNRSTHALLPGDSNEPRCFIAPSGSGPRHVVFGPDGHFVYLLTELSAQVLVLRWDAAQGTLTLVQSISITSEAFSGAKSSAAIAVSQDGRFIYAENRGENSLVVYRVNAKTGELSLVQRTPSSGERPWGFAIHPSGKWLLVANQRSGSVNVFSIDPDSGTLSDTGQSLDIPTPVSVSFMP
jgi:6-phosphogluconolactonase